MKKEISEIVHLIIKTDANFPVEIRTLAKWCIIDWGDYSYSPGPYSSRTYRKKGKYTILLSAEKLRYLQISGTDCMFASFSDCKNLTRLYVNNTGLHSIDLRGCKELRYLYCENNWLTYLDLYDSPKLCRLECGYNSLSSLVLWRTTGIKYLKCNNNSLKELRFPVKNTLVNLDCSDNLLSKKELQKIFYRLKPDALKVARIKCWGNPGFPSCNVKRIIAKGWNIGRDKRLTA